MYPRSAAYLFTLALFALVTSMPAPAQNVHLKIIALNDFHGNLQSPGTTRADANSPGSPAGGIETLAAYVAQLKRQNPNHIVVSAGDLTGASPLLSALFHDEPTIETMNRLGLDLNAVGNHEFDKGTADLLRRQTGGCSHLDTNTCKGADVGTPVPFEGAKFKYLAANVFDTTTGKTIFPAYDIKTYGGIKVAFIGLTLKDTPNIVIPSGVAGLRFADEADTINANVRTLRRHGVEAFVILIHQGGAQTTDTLHDINACAGNLAGWPIASIVSKLDDSVGLIISAHTHQPYVCHLPNRTGRPIPVTSAASYGRLFTNIDVTLSRKTHRILTVTAHNLVVDRSNPDLHPDPAIQSIVDRYAALAAPLINRPVGTITATISRDDNPAGESALGDLIADAQLAATSTPATGNAVAAFMNNDGVRAPLRAESPTTITYGQLFSVQPFANDVVTLTLTGAQIKVMLEEQFKGCTLGDPAGAAPNPANHVLEVSEGFTYTWSPSRPICDKVDPATIQLNGVPILPSAPYRITVNSFLADGGNAFYILKQGTARRTGPTDLEAAIAYLATHPDIAPPPPHRITLKP